MAQPTAAYNIDTQGDMLTGCSSPSHGSVTATNNNDVRTFSGYGATTTVWVRQASRCTCQAGLQDTATLQALRLRVRVWLAPLPWCTALHALI